MPKQPKTISFLREKLTPRANLEKEYPNRLLYKLRRVSSIVADFRYLNEELQEEFIRSRFLNHPKANEIAKQIMRKYHIDYDSNISAILFQSGFEFELFEVYMGRTNFIRLAKATSENLKNKLLEKMQKHIYSQLKNINRRSTILANKFYGLKFNEIIDLVLNICKSENNYELLLRTILIYNPPTKELRKYVSNNELERANFSTLLKAKYALNHLH